MRATGTVIAATHSGYAFDEVPQHTLTFSVKSPGGAPYETTLEAPTSRAEAEQRFAPGNGVPIPIDPKDPTHIALT